MTFYGMHDAPSTKQNLNTFKKKDGTRIQTGDTHDIMMPWGFMNPFLEKKLYENSFYCMDSKCYKKEINIKKLQEFVKENKEELENIPILKKWLKNHDIEGFIQSSKKMKQSYMFMSLNNDDYLVIRGKKSILQEAYVFQVIEQGLLRYTEDCKPYMTFRVVCKVPFEIYDKLEARRSSFWKLLPRDFKEIKELVK